MTLRSHRTLLLLATFVLMITLWVVGHRRLQARRLALDLQAAETVRLLDLTSAEWAENDRLRQELDVERSAAQYARARASSLVTRSEAPAAESRWNAPPESLPDWTPDSPYLWIRKSLLPGFPVEPFADSGALQSVLASVFALEPERERALNTELSRLQAEAREAQSASAMLSATAPSGIADQPGDKVTLVVPGQTETLARLRSEAESLLRTGLGAARSELVMTWGSSWLDQQFGNPEALPTTYSVVRHPDNTYHLSITSGMGGMSVGGTEMFINYIPTHLRPWFAPLQNPEGATGKAIGDGR